MKTSRKIIAMLLSAILMFSLSATAFAASTEQKVQYGSFSGIVKAITPAGQAGNTIVNVEKADGNIANIVVSPTTAQVTDTKIAVGSKIIAFYDATLPMIMIYPPQYSAVAVAVLGEGQSIKVDKFDSKMLSGDGSLVLHISKNTQIVSQSGKPYSGSLENRTLVVLYGIVLDSYPMQTSPDKIIVLLDPQAVAVGDVSKKPIVVNGKAIKASKAYVNKQGVVMVPLKAIAKALGMKVLHNASNAPHTISYKIGVDSYKTYLQADPIKLGTAPALRWGVTYVPLSFFDQVVKVDAAYVSDTQIVIENH